MFDDKSQYIGRLLFLLDSLLTLLTLILAYQFSYQITQGDRQPLFYYLAVYVLLWAPLGYFLLRFGAYHGLRILSLPTFAWSVTKALSLSLAIVFTILFLLDVNMLSRTVLVTFSIFELLALIGVRMALHWWYFLRFAQKGENYLKVVIIGTGKRARRLAKTLKEHLE